MAHLLTIEVEAPPDTIDILVDYYDDREKAALLHSVAAALLGDFPRVLRVPTSDLLSYFLYYKRRLGIDGHSTFDEIRAHCHHALVEFDGQIGFDSSSIRALAAQGTDDGTTERLGEAIGLSVINLIHGLHAGDWDRIPRARGKTLDFTREWAASDGSRIIQLETKGSVTRDNSRKVSAVSNHKADIKKKKDELSNAVRRASVLYGTIAVLDDTTDSVARCWLVDPPPDAGDDPARFKLIARLRYIAGLVSVIGGRSQLSASLQTRLATLDGLDNVDPLSGVPLLKGDGSAYSTETYDITGSHNPWFGSKSVVHDGPAGGQVMVLDENNLLFVAIQEQLLVLAIEQDFGAIRAYRLSGGTVDKRVDCSVPVGRFEQEFEGKVDIPKEMRWRHGGYIDFSIHGNLHYTQSGFVLGILPISGLRWR